MSDVDWDTIDATPLALEIHGRFWKKMAPGGEIDRILNGGDPIEKRAPAPDAEIELRQRQIDTQMREYEGAIGAAVIWYRDWKAGRKGFRAKRRRPAPQSEAASE